MYIPDPIERMEDSAERWADEHIEGDNFKCGCGKMCSLDDGETLDTNPYAPPVCPDCFAEWYDQMEKKLK